MKVWVVLKRFKLGSTHLLSGEIKLLQIYKQFAYFFVTEASQVIHFVSAISKIDITISFEDLTSNVIRSTATADKCNRQHLS